MQTEMQRPRSGEMQGGTPGRDTSRSVFKYIRKRLLTLFLGYLKLRNFQSQSGIRQTVDVYVDMYIPSKLCARA